MDRALFTFTPNARIKRIIQELYLSHKDNARPGFQPSIFVDAFLPGESLSVREDENTLALLDYLDKQAIATCNIGYAAVEIRAVIGEFHVISQLQFHITDPKKLHELYSEVQKAYYEHDTAQFSEDGTLTVNDTTIYFQIGTPAYNLLKLLFLESDSRKQVWSYTDKDLLSLKHYVYRPSKRDVAEFCRDAGRYINKQVAKKLDCTHVLLVTTKQIQINPAYYG